MESIAIVNGLSGDSLSRDREEIESRAAMLADPACILEFAFEGKPIYAFAGKALADHIYGACQKKDAA